MEREIRNLLERTTQQARSLLETEYARQLEGTYDILPDGTIHAAAGKHLTAPEEQFFRGRLVAAIEHRRAQGEGPQDSVANFLRECAFTFLNRVVALRMLEARGIIKQSISKAEDSTGFVNEYLLLAPGLKNLQDKGYRLFLESLFDEIGCEIGVLFDRNDLPGQLWPDRARLLQLLNLLNNPGLDAAWGADETIGWVYQYFNSDEERRAMRAQSSSPQNSREMAVRNQFFTPRYVVEFLTDNTLGRIWYEMVHGRTSLKERCQFMVRRPNEHFLQPGESAPEVESSRDRTQDELIEEPVFIDFRAPKDPREILVLDPACGSGHFLLYCFDLFETIYEEAWDSNVGSLRSDYPDRALFLDARPALILKHNLHGIDIDPRAAQICSLALWMRAQRTWEDIPRATRRTIRRTNIVIAEPMPGEHDLLKEFCEGLDLESTLIGQLVRGVFEHMKIAGDAGALLRVEADIAEMVEDLKQQWLAEERPTDRLGNPLLFAKDNQRTIFEGERIHSDFWPYAEECVFKALAHFAESADTKGFRRRLFAEDAERGFAFLDLCRKRFDVILMNPPFGDASLPSKAYIDDSYGDTKGDVYKAFVEGAFDRLVPAGALGMISSRNALFLNQSADWRKRVIRRLFRCVVLADFGDGVLDAAVSTAGYVLRRINKREEANLTLDLLPALASVPVTRVGFFSVPKYQRHRSNLRRHQAVQELSWLEAGGFIKRVPGHFTQFEVLRGRLSGDEKAAYKSDPVLTCICLLLEVDKGAGLLKSVKAMQEGYRDDLTYLVRPSSFDLVPTSPFAYWVSDRVRRLFQRYSRLDSEGRTAKQGLATADDFRFVRCWWEVSSNRVMDGCDSWKPERFIERTYEGVAWVWFGKGGGLRPFCADLNLVVNYEGNGQEIKAWASVLENGAHWSKRIASTDYYFRGGLAFGRRLRRFGVVPLPKGALFSDTSPLITSTSTTDYLPLSAYLSSNIVRAILGLMTPPRKNEVGYVANLPVPSSDRGDSIMELASLGNAYGLSSVANASMRETHARFRLPSRRIDHESSSTTEHLFENGGRIDELVARTLELTPEDQTDLLRSLAWVSGLKSDSNSAEEDEEDDGSVQRSQDEDAVVRKISLAVGCVFGRWDIRKWLSDAENAISIDPYAPMPAFPPAGLESEREQLTLDVDGIHDGAYPLKIEQAGILVEEENHPADICQRATECLGLVEEKPPHIVQEEIAKTFRVGNAREYFNSPRLFFQSHLDRYFKSRRRAPIYWQLAIPSRKYALWLYYNRLDQDTLWKAISDFAKPKVAQEERRLMALRGESGDSPTQEQRRAIQDQESFVSELVSFRETIELVAPIWNPNLDDGVILNFCVLWKLVPQLPNWQRELRECWQKLCAGDYDWSKIAMHLWPERVIPKCVTDRSLAIAHGLEGIFWKQQPDGKWTAEHVGSSETKVLIDSRTSKPIKSALERLLSQPAASSPRRTRRNV